MTMFIDKIHIGWIYNVQCEFECRRTSRRFHAADPLFFDKVWDHIEKLEGELLSDGSIDILRQGPITKYKI